MVRSELISEISQKIQHKLKKSDLEIIFSIIIESIIVGLKNNKSTEFRNFGRFSLKNLEERINRNQRPGENVNSPKKKSIAFKMAKELKKKINDDEAIN